MLDNKNPNESSSPSDGQISLLMEIAMLGIESLIKVFAALAFALCCDQAQAQTSTVVVPANVEWFDTGVDVQAGVTFLLTISATGSWTNVSGGQSVSAAGYGSLKLPNSIAPAEPFASLIGRVNGAIFGLGESFRKRSPASGRLFLAMNDIPGMFGDNSGELTVEITHTTNFAVTVWKDPVLFLDLLSPDPQPFFERPSFRWTLRNKNRAPFSGEIVVLLDGARASINPAPPLIIDLGPSSERTGTFVLFTGSNPFLAAGDHIVTAELRALTPNHELLAAGNGYVTSFVPSPPPSISIASFKADPSYQDQGKEIKLTWTLQPTSYCVPADLILKKKDVGEPEVFILQAPTPSSPGGVKDFVKGTSSPLIYVLSVACKPSATGQTLLGTTATSEVKVTFSPAPPPPTPNVVHNGPFFAPIWVKEKSPFSVSWTFQNVGGAKSEEFDVQLYLDGVKEGDKQTVPAFDPGKSKNLAWAITKELLSGSHTLELRAVSTGGALDYHPFPVSP
jgi:hypothetical protein